MMTARDWRKLLRDCSLYRFRVGQIVIRREVNALMYFRVRPGLMRVLSICLTLPTRPPANGLVIRTGRGCAGNL